MITASVFLLPSGYHCVTRASYRTYHGKKIKSQLALSTGSWSPTVAATLRTFCPCCCCHCGFVCALWFCKKKKINKKLRTDCKRTDDGLTIARRTLHRGHTIVAVRQEIKIKIKKKRVKVSSNAETASFFFFMTVNHWRCYGCNKTRDTTAMFVGSTTATTVLRCAVG